MFILATLAVIVVIGALFVGNMQQNKRDAIVLPDAAQSTQPELQPDENEPALLEVTRENVQSIVRSLRRPPPSPTANSSPTTAMIPASRSSPPRRRGLSAANAGSASATAF